MIDEVGRDLVTGVAARCWLATGHLHQPPYGEAQVPSHAEKLRRAPGNISAAITAA